MYFFRSEQRFRSRRFAAMNHQAMQSNAQRKPLDGQRAHLDAAAGDRLQAPYDQPAKQWIAGSTNEKYDNNQEGEGGQHPWRVYHPAPDRMAAFALHDGPGSSIFSTRTRPRLSFSQRSA